MIESYLVACAFIAFMFLQSRGFFSDKPSKSADVESVTVLQLSQKIKSVDISDIESVELFPNGSRNIRINSRNFFKIAKLIVDSTGKTEFVPNELAKTYRYVLDNYETQTDDGTFAKIKDALGVFVAQWGRVDIRKGKRRYSELPTEVKLKIELPKIPAGEILWRNLFRFFGTFFLVILSWPLVYCGILILLGLFMWFDNKPWF